VVSRPVEPLDAATEPVLIAIAFERASRSCGGGGRVVKGRLVVANPGGVAAGASLVRMHLSRDATPDEGDVVVIAALPVDPIEHGTVFRRRFRFVSRGARGRYLIAVADAGNAVPEADESNNVFVSSRLRSSRWCVAPGHRDASRCEPTAVARSHRPGLHRRPTPISRGSPTSRTSRRGRFRQPRGPILYETGASSRPS
jgi:hypothetical protein